MTAGPFLPFGYYGSYYGTPGFVDPPTVYASPSYGSPYGYPLGYPPMAAVPSFSSSLYAPPPAPPDAPAPPESRVVVYSTGRYELRGDGVSTPYVWVWVPNPPTGPPPDSPSATPSGTASSATASSHEAYRWTDANGVTTWTDRLDKVPARYRAEAQALAQH